MTSISRVKGRTEMRWVPISAGVVRKLIDSATETVTDEYDGTTLYFHANGISAFRRIADVPHVYETDFREALTEIDVTELQEGDVIWHCLDDGPVSSHRQHRTDYLAEMVYFKNGSRDSFGRPQKLEVLRGGQF